MFTTATLTIDNFLTTLTLTGDGEGRERINVLGDGSRQRAADNELTKRGYTRLTGWEYATDRDAFVATITAD